MAVLPTLLPKEITDKYSIENNTLSLLVKDDPKDRLEVEVGDSKQSDTFFPQVKLLRWDNEVNLSVRLINNEIDEEVVSAKDEKIIWENGDLEANFYEVPPSSDYPRGGYEFEIILNKKPETNKIEFSLQSKGLVFYYQGELTDEEIREGCFRPQNVVGSYAVYYKDHPLNLTDGKTYRSGKAFHIYRPRITDAEGKSVWGELIIDLDRGLLSVTIPQQFIDNAIYPVKHAAGLNFGYETGGESWVGYTNRYYGSVFAGSAGTGVSMSWYEHVGGTASGNKSKMALYVHDGGTAYTPLANGSTVERSGSLSADQFYTDNFVSAPTLTAIDYALIWWDSTSNRYIGYDNGDVNQGHYNTITYGAWPNPLNVYHNNFKYSIYCTYNPPAVAGGKPPSLTLLNVG